MCEIIIGYRYMCLLLEENENIYRMLRFFNFFS
jgi:hypothetical protein